MQKFVNMLYYALRKGANVALEECHVPKEGAQTAPQWGPGPERRPGKPERAGIHTPGAGEVQCLGGGVTTSTASPKGANAPGTTVSTGVRFVLQILKLMV